MDKQEFITKVQDPYKQTWTIVLLAQKAIYTGKQEDWDMYAKEADRFAKEGIHNPFQDLCATFVYNATDVIKKMNEGTNDVQNTK